MKNMLRTILDEHRHNCGDIRGRDGEYLSDAVDNLIDLIKGMVDDDELERLRRDSLAHSWTINPEGMGR